jgi:murein DD-endopeptidase MepM/ murein hydrolase activator NlpD
MRFTLLPPRRVARVVFAFSLLAAPLSWAAAAQGQYHVLAKGETLYSVARQYGLKPGDIAKANSIDDPSKLKAGTKLLIPGSGDKAAPAAAGADSPAPAAAPSASAKGPVAVSAAVAMTHKVVKGDTLFSIAKAYGVGLSDLRAANKLAVSSTIKPGDTLKIPAGGTPGVGAVASSEPAVGPAPGSETVETVKPGAIRTVEPIVPDPVKTSVKTVSNKVSWPCPGEILYLEGKAYGVIIKSKLGEVSRAVTAGTVSSAGPYRGYGNVVFILSRTGHIYVYGGNDRISVRAGDRVSAGQELGRIGQDLKQGGPVAYFLVFKNGEAVDPALAPRD